MEDKIRLQLVGITYNQIESGVYAVILKEAEGTRRIPIIIGSNEAQSIECRLQEVVTPRPLTHDLMVSLINAYGLTLREVELRRLPSGVFAANMYLVDSTGNEVVLDSRSSDALAIAVRTGSPIYTSSQVLEEAGFEPEAKEQPRPAESATIVTAKGDYSEFTVAQLEKRMQQAVEAENYEEAALIKKELESRK